MTNDLLTRIKDVKKLLINWIEFSIAINQKTEGREYTRVLSLLSDLRDEVARLEKELKACKRANSGLVHIIGAPR